MGAQRIVAGNWKMNKSFHDGLELVKAMTNEPIPSDVQVILGVPYIHLQAAQAVVAGRTDLFIAAQNCHQEDKGAYTGEISLEMLNSLGLKYVIVGHSERRQYFGDTDEIVRTKVQKCLDRGIQPIYCCGEPLDIREAGSHVEYVLHQLEVSLGDLSPEAVKRVIIAYEPIWAIGTGKTASTEQAQEMHAAIRTYLIGKFSEEVAAKLTILYGGSCNAKNAEALFAQEDVDGGLIGGASLILEDFRAIINAYN